MPSESSLKKYLLAHFRIIIVFIVLLALIFFISPRIQRSTEVLPFTTFFFDASGEAASVGPVKILFDYQTDSYTLNTTLPAGTYTLESTATLIATSNGLLLCSANLRSKYCTISLSQPSPVQVSFHQAGMDPNGRFRFNFPNRTTVDVDVVLGDNHSFVALNSIQPSSLHGYFQPLTNVVSIQTFAGATEDRTNFVDFEVQSLDAVTKRANDTNSWLQNFVLVPLVLAFFILLVTELINYAQKLLKRAV